MTSDQNLAEVVERLKRRAEARRPPLHVRLRPIFDDIDALLRDRRLTLRDVADELGVSLAGLNLALRKLREDRRQAAHAAPKPAPRKAPARTTAPSGNEGGARLVGPSAHARSLDPGDL